RRRRRAAGSSRVRRDVLVGGRRMPIVSFAKMSVALRSRARGGKVTPSGDHGSKYRVEVIGPGRQDWFSEPQILFQERPPHLWHRSFSCFSVRPASVLHLFPPATDDDDHRLLHRNSRAPPLLKRPANSRPTPPHQPT